ncbi:MAG: GNAT family N-acetyltransferase [Thermomicrobiales bacterium]
MTSHHDIDQLDNLIWHALTTRQAPLAIVNGAARQFPADVAPFVAMEHPSIAAYHDLAELVAGTDRAVLFTAERLTPPPDLLAVTFEIPLTQMIATHVGPPAGTLDVIELGPADVPEMIALVELTQPGPYKQRTIRLGRYIGVRREGKLVAMAGERLKPEGFTEISAVCTHPDWRNHGFASELVSLMVQHIREAGDTPILHTGSHNSPAISVYDKLGFTLRRELWVSAVELVSADALAKPELVSGRA